MECTEVLLQELGRIVVDTLEAQTVSIGIGSVEDTVKKPRLSINYDSEEPDATTYLMVLTICR